MSETLLDIVQAAANEVLVPVPTSAVGSPDEIAQGLLAMANASGRDLARRAEWGALVTLAAIPTVAGQSDYPLPADYHRLVDDTVWDRSTGWVVPGPLTPQADRWLRESQWARSLYYRNFRLLGRTALRVTPTPVDASGLVVFEYVSRFWCVGSGANAGKAAAAFGLDTDTTVFDFDLMIKAVKWRWMAAKGQDAVELRAEYEDALSSLIAADQGGGTLDMSGGLSDDLGGQAYAGTSPNFRISTGSGSNILVD